MELAIISFSITLIGCIIIIIDVYYDKYKYLLIAINKIDENIKILLNQKYDLLIKIMEFLKDSIKINEDELQDFLNTNLREVDNKSLSKLLDITKENIYHYFDDNEKLINKDRIKELNTLLKETDMKLSSLKKYYNTIIKNYNRLVVKFPGNLIGKIFKYYKLKEYSILRKDELKILENESNDEKKEA